MHGLMEYECQTENYRACESVSSFQQTVDSVVFGLVMLQLFRTFIVNAAGFDMEPIESLDLWHCDIHIVVVRSRQNFAAIVVFVVTDSQSRRYSKTIELTN